MRKFKLLTIICVTLGVILTNKVKTSSITNDNVLMSNIEALANNENGKNINECIHIGTIECPNGGYAECVFLKIDNEASLN